MNPGDLDASIAQAYERGAAATAVQRRLAEVRGTGATEGNLVTAVVSGSGELVDLRITAEALRLGPGKLGEAIVAAAGFASEDARQRGYTLLALALGDEAAAEVERLDRPTPVRARGWDTAAAPEANRPDASHAEASSTGASRSVERDADADTESDDDVFSFDASIFRSDR